MGIRAGLSVLTLFMACQEPGEREIWCVEPFDRGVSAPCDRAEPVDVLYSETNWFLPTERREDGELTGWTQVNGWTWEATVTTMDQDCGQPERQHRSLKDAQVRWIWVWDSNCELAGQRHYVRQPLDRGRFEMVVSNGDDVAIIRPTPDLEPVDLGWIRGFFDEQPDDVLFTEQLTRPGRPDLVWSFSLGTP